MFVYSRTNALTYAFIRTTATRNGLKNTNKNNGRPYLRRRMRSHTHTHTSAHWHTLTHMRQTNKLCGCGLNEVILADGLREVWWLQQEAWRGTNQRRETTDTHRRENKVWGESLLLCVHIKIRQKKLRKQLRQQKQQQQHCGDGTKRPGSCDSWRSDAVIGPVSSFKEWTDFWI